MFRNESKSGRVFAPWSLHSSVAPTTEGKWLRVYKTLSINSNVHASSDSWRENTADPSSALPGKTRLELGQRRQPAYNSSMVNLTLKCPSVQPNSWLAYEGSFVFLDWTQLNKKAFANQGTNPGSVSPMSIYTWPYFKVSLWGFRGTWSLVVTSAGPLGC